MLKLPQREVVPNGHNVSLIRLRQMVSFVGAEGYKTHK